MKKLVVSLFIMVAASFFFVCGASAASQVQFSLQPGETMVVYLDNQYSFEVPGDSKGDYGFFNWTVSETPISHSGLIKSSVVNYAGASMPNITVSAQRDSTYSGNFTFMFDSSVASGSNVRLYLSVAVTLQNQTNDTISGYMGLTLSGWSYSASNIPNTGTLDEKLNQILDALGTGFPPDYLGEDAYFYFSSDYFTRAWGAQSEYFSDDGYMRLTAGSSSGIQFYNDPSDSFLQSVSLPAGTYILSLAIPGSVSDITSVLGGSYLDSSLVVANGYTYFTGIITTTSIVNTHSFSIYWSGTSGTGLIYGGVSSAPSDFVAGSAVNPDQSGLVSDVDNAGQQQQAQEDQLWTNINSFKGDLTFNIDDWSEAAGGLSYVSGIFMQIWNNSPTQIIILSLMLGIAMLSIGRGAMAAVRVSRNRRDDD